MLVDVVFVSAQEGPPNYGQKEPYTVQYFDQAGNMTIRCNGTKAWRNNNPGNIIHKPGGFAVRHGSIGHAGGMAVFPDESTGRTALIALLHSTNYRNLTIGDVSERYDKPNAAEHRRMLLSISKLDPNLRIIDLTGADFSRLREAFERIEGWEPGREDFIERWIIVGVHKKKR